jgi:phosphoenolpyruvate carboxykinase (ATP)
MVDAIHERKLDETETRIDPVFGFEVPKRIVGVPEQLLDPRANWPDPAAYDLALRKLAQQFISNFSRYASSAGTRLTAAGPVL